MRSKMIRCIITLFTFMLKFCFVLIFRKFRPQYTERLANRTERLSNCTEVPHDIADTR